MNRSDSEPAALPIKTFHVHKAGETARDYQDAFAYNLKHNRFAVADGATRDFFSGLWADLLVKRFCQNDAATTRLFETHEWQKWLEPVRQAWSEQVGQIVGRANPGTAYFLINRFNRGDPATATFAGLQLSEIENGRLTWLAMIQGDACLFHIHNNEVTTYGPQTPEQFDYHPNVFSSIDNGLAPGEPSFHIGQGSADDTFILITDALAKWLLERAREQGWNATLESVHALQSYDAFLEYIAWAREQSEIALENDDVTFSLISARPAEPVLIGPADSGRFVDKGSDMAAIPATGELTRKIQSQNGQTPFLDNAATTGDVAAVVGTQSKGRISHKAQRLMLLSSVAILAVVIGLTFLLISDQSPWQNIQSRIAIPTVIQTWIFGQEERTYHDSWENNFGSELGNRIYHDGWENGYGNIATRQAEPAPISEDENMATPTGEVENR